MKSKFLFALALPLLAVPALADGMKAGLWEMKTVKQVVDGKDMMAQMAAAQAKAQQAMAKMTPEQRKQMESMMGGRGAAMMGGGGEIRVCVSEEMASRKTPLVDREGRCQPTRMSQSGNTTRFEFDCDADGRHMTGKGESTVAGNSIGTRMDMTTTDASGRHTMQTESQMSWLGADCKGLAPAGLPKRK